MFLTVKRNTLADNVSAESAAVKAQGEFFFPPANFKLSEMFNLCWISVVLHYYKAYNPFPTYPFVCSAGLSLFTSIMRKNFFIKLVMNWLPVFFLLLIHRHGGLQIQAQWRLLCRPGLPWKMPLWRNHSGLLQSKAQQNAWPHSSIYSRTVSLSPWWHGGWEGITAGSNNCFWSSFNTPWNVNWRPCQAPAHGFLIF